ncbi:MAG TPA: hypothetical protein DD979_05250 [Gammaproteobacteria bacterium]|nr:hypothetical protein [Gammaproteobacteria bacterium]
MPVRARMTEPQVVANCRKPQTNAQTLSVGAGRVADVFIRKCSNGWLEYEAATVYRSRSMIKQTLTSAIVIALSLSAGCSSDDDNDITTDPTETGADVNGGDTGADNGTDSDTSTASGVDAGYARVVVAGDTVTLNATVAEGTLQWSQIAGPAVTLSDSSTEDPRFTAPTVSQRETLLFELQVDSGSETLTDQVSVEVWVASDTGDATALGYFSGRSGWGCDQDPIATPSVIVTDLGSVMQYESNGVPSHATGTFPNNGNPNAITVQSIVHEIPTNPEKLTTTTNMRDNGITLDGIKLARDTAESYQNANQWHYEAITPGIAAGNYEWSWLGTDCNNAHVQPGGEYHYHGLMEAALNQTGEQDGTASDMVLGGYAADGFPFYLRYGYVDANDPSSA